MKRHPTMRQEPLEHRGSERKEQSIGDQPFLRVWSAPGYMVWVEAMWHGDYQQVPVDPDRIDDLIKALEQAKRHANSDED